MTARLNQLHDALGLLRLALVRATEADDQARIAEVDELTITVLNQLEAELTAITQAEEHNNVVQA